MENGNTPKDSHDIPTLSVPTPPAHSFRATVYEWVKVFFFALLIALPIRYFIAEPFIVNGASMDPTFSTNQFLIVDRLTYRFQEPQRGDVIVFKFPNNPSIYYIKRVIGLPGETVSLTNGKVSSQDTGASSTAIVLDESYLDPARLSHDSFRITLDEGQYFVMGDNRLESSDSRTWGPLSTDLIIGRPIIRLFPVTALSVFPGQNKK